MVTTTTKYATLRIDDYLDLLNFAKEIDDVKWQKEIIRKLKRMNDSSSSHNVYECN